jgi:hypothetical protein
MAKRKKRAKAQPKKRAKRTGRAQNAAKSPQRGATKRAVGRAKPKSATKNAARTKQQRMKSLETVVVDVIEEPAPGLITITEFEEQVPSRGWVGTKGDRED